MSLKQQIISDLTASMKAQDAPRTSTLRMVKAALMNREIEKGSELDDDEMTKLLRSLVKQRRDSVEQYETGANSMKDMGRVMKAVQTALSGKNADGRTVSEIVKTKLGG